MTCIVDPARFPTKKSLKAAVEADSQLVGQRRTVWIEDPSIFAPRTFLAVDIRPGEVVFVTNHPKRSWFAQVGRTKEGRLYVK